MLERTNSQCPIKTILNGIEIIDTTKYKMRTFNEQRLTLLYVGRLFHQEKGIFLLPEIVKIIRDTGIDVTLDVVGEGNDRDAFVEKIQAMGMTDHINMRGAVSTEELYQSLCGSHFLLFPSFTEGLPMVPIEAQMCGCIPIASLIKGSTDCLIESGKTGELHAIGDYQSMAHSVIRLWDQRTTLPMRSEQCIRYARERFSVEAMGEAYYDLIINAAGGGYPLQKERGKIETLDAMDRVALYSDLSDLLFITKDARTTELYHHWMKASYIHGRSIGKYLVEHKVRRAALFGTFKTGLYLYKELREANVEIKVFLDNNTEMHGKEFYGIEVCSPTWLLQHADEIDAVIVSIESDADVIVCKQLRKLVPDSNILITSWKELVRRSC
jgi:Glycosyl transferases group 1